MLEIGRGSSQVALLAVEEREWDADLDAGFESNRLPRRVLLRVVPETRADKEVGDTLGTHSFQSRSCPLDIDMRLSDLRTVAKHAGQHGVAVEPRRIGGQIPVGLRDQPRGVPSAGRQPTPDRVA